MPVMRVWSTARHNQCFTPAILSATSSRCHLSPTRGWRRRINPADNTHFLSGQQRRVSLRLGASGRSLAASRLITRSRGRVRRPFHRHGFTARGSAPTLLLPERNRLLGAIRAWHCSAVTPRLVLGTTKATGPAKGLLSVRMLTEAEPSDESQLDPDRDNPATSARGSGRADVRKELALGLRGVYSVVDYHIQPARDAYEAALGSISDLWEAARLANLHGTSAALPAAVRAPTIACSSLSGFCNAKTFRNRRDRCRPGWAWDAAGGDGRAASG